MAKNNSPKNDEEKLDIENADINTNITLQKKREEETERQQQEAALLKAQHEKEEHEEYEKKLHDERIELLRMKQGVISEEESSIHEEKEEKTDLPFWKKVGNFFYHNKWWLGITTVFAALIIVLVIDLVLSNPHPDMRMILLTSNKKIKSASEFNEFFTDQCEDFNDNGEVLVSFYDVYSPEKEDNFIASTYVTSTDAVIVLGEKSSIEEIYDSEDVFADLSSLYPDDPHVNGRFYYLKDTDFAHSIGLDPKYIPDDMVLAIRDPSTVNKVNQVLMQKTYDKDFPVFDRIIKSLSK